MRYHFLALLAALTPLALADVKFTSPAGGATIAGGGSITITWVDSGTSPSLSDLTTYQIFLCAGGNDPNSFIVLTTLVTTGVFANGNKASGTITATLGGSVPDNAYFLKIQSVASTGGTVQNFSPRFTLSGMTGTLPANIIANAGAVTVLTGPDTINAVTSGSASAVDANAFDTPFNEQTGLTKYAPMMAIPPTKITKKVKTPLFPTSSVVLASTYLPEPSQQTTITQSQTLSISMIENTVAAASQPTDDMQKFLNRWKD